MRSTRKGVSFYSPSTEKKNHVRLAAAAWFGRLLATVSGSSDDPSVITNGLTDSSCSPLALSCFNVLGFRASVAAFFMS
jgi:hypothetical protein